MMAISEITFKMELTKWILTFMMWTMRSCAAIRYMFCISLIQNVEYAFCFGCQCGQHSVVIDVHWFHRIRLKVHDIGSGFVPANVWIAGTVRQSFHNLFGTISLQQIFRYKHLFGERIDWRQFMV